MALRSIPKFNPANTWPTLWSCTPSTWRINARVIFEEGYNRQFLTCIWASSVRCGRHRAHWYNSCGVPQGRSASASRALAALYNLLWKNKVMLYLGQNIIWTYFHTWSRTDTVEQTLHASIYCVVSRELIQSALNRASFPDSPAQLWESTNCK